MKTITKKVFTVDELSDGAKEKAYYSWLSTVDHWHINSKFEKLLKDVENTFDVSITDYNIDTLNSWINFRANYSDEILQLSGKRLLAYVWNNFHGIWQGKYYGKLFGTPPEYRHKKRYSKVLLTIDECPFSGCWVDCAVTDEIKKLWEKRKYGQTFQDFLESMFDRIAKYWQQDIEYNESKEFFLEECENQELFFSEDGEEMFYPWELDK